MSTHPYDRKQYELAAGAWHSWANHHYPQDLGDEGGHDQEMLDRFLRELRAWIVEDDELPPVAS